MRCPFMAMGEGSFCGDLSKKERERERELRNFDPLRHD